jgi:hypothetical protein
MTALMLLLRLYAPIGAVILAGMALGQGLASRGHTLGKGASLHQQLPHRLGQGLFWVGLPLSVVGFLNRIDLSSQLYLAPVVAWATILSGLACSRLWIAMLGQRWPRSTRVSFSLAAMLGNTGFIGYPVILLLPQLGLEGFGWALFYDAMGTLLGSYGLGAVLAQGSVPGGWQQGWRTILRNPILAAFGLGLLLRPLPLPTWLDTGLYRIAWLVVGLSLLLMGLRIQQLRSWQHLPRATVAIAIKMVLAPLMVGLALTALGIGGVPRLVMVLQAGMPSAFANLVLAETYDLDRDLAVTCVGLSSASLLVTLPLWLWGFPA